MPIFGYSVGAYPLYNTGLWHRLSLLLAEAVESILGALPELNHQRLTHPRTHLPLYTVSTNQRRGAHANTAQSINQSILVSWIGIMRDKYSATRQHI